MGAALPWVKLHTKIVASPKWLSQPVYDRAVFLFLLALSGATGGEGRVDGTDAECADALHLDRAAYSASVDRLCADGVQQVRRVPGGVEIVKWSEYQPGRRLLSHSQRGLTATTPVAVPVVREEKIREEKSRGGLLPALDALAALPGWVTDESRDIELVEELTRRYPLVDLVASLSGLRDWLLDGGTTGNLRNTVRNRVAKSFEFGKDLRVEPVAAGWHAG